MGKIGKITIDIILCLTYMSFLMSQMAFVFENTKLLFDYLIFSQYSTIIAATLITIIYFFLIQQLDLKKFSFIFVVGSTILFIVCIKVIFYCFYLIN